MAALNSKPCLATPQMTPEPGLTFRSKIDAHVAKMLDSKPTFTEISYSSRSPCNGPLDIVRIVRRPERLRIDSHGELPGLIQKLIIPTDQHRSKLLQMTGLSLDVRLQRVSAAVEILPRPHGLLPGLGTYTGTKVSNAVPSSNGANSAWRRHRHENVV